MDFIKNSILYNPSVFLGLIVTIGLLIQKQNIADVIKGSLLAAFGVVILDAGGGMIDETIPPINNAFTSSFVSEITEGLNDITFTASYGADVGMEMFIGLMLNPAIVRFTPIKTIYLTGHMVQWLPLIFIAAGVEGVNRCSLN